MGDVNICNCGENDRHTCIIVLVILIIFYASNFHSNFPNIFDQWNKFCSFLSFYDIVFLDGCSGKDLCDFFHFFKTTACFLLSSKVVKEEYLKFKKWIIYYKIHPNDGTTFHNRRKVNQLSTMRISLSSFLMVFYNTYFID
jgi:hypothetical protein